jgi:hypothetical protein
MSHIKIIFGQEEEREQMFFAFRSEEFDVESYNTKLNVPEHLKNINGKEEVYMLQINNIREFKQFLIFIRGFSELINSNPLTIMSGYSAASFQLHKCKSVLGVNWNQ